MSKPADSAARKPIAFHSLFSAREIDRIRRDARVMRAGALVMRQQAAAMRVEAVRMLDKLRRLEADSLGVDGSGDSV